MASCRPIGIFDSGVGGLTVANAISLLLPNETIFYIGDTARIPYGNKSAVPFYYEIFERTYLASLDDKWICEKYGYSHEEHAGSFICQRHNSRN